MVARLVRFCKRRAQKNNINEGGHVHYLRRNELEPSELSPCLFVNDVLDFRVDLRQRLVQDLVLQSHACELDYMLRAETMAHVVGRGRCGHCSANERSCGTKRMVGEERAKHLSLPAYGGICIFLTEGREDQGRVPLPPATPLRKIGP